MMTWDEFSKRWSRIEEKTDPDIRRIILAEFGDDWSNLAFAILEVILYDRLKYSDICYGCTKERQHAVAVADARYLSDKLEQFKREYKGE